MLPISMSPNGTASVRAQPENAENQDVPDTLTWTASPDGLVTLTPDAGPGLACAIQGTGAGTPTTPCVISVSDGKITDTVVITFKDEVITSLNLSILVGPT
jgi:hypothetical protein